MWEFYLAASEVAFRYQNFVVFQVQLIKYVDTFPLTPLMISPDFSAAALTSDRAGM